MDQVDAQAMLPLLLWEVVPDPQPGVPLRGGRQPRRLQNRPQDCA
jgi:hypothetical protein